MIISFAWTTEAVVMGEKTRTRRAWKPQHAEKFKQGLMVDGWSRIPRVKGAQKICYIEIEREPFIQNTRDLNDEDWKREGLQYMYMNNILIAGKPATQFFHDWKLAEINLYVVDFKLLFLTNVGKRMKIKLNGGGHDN